MRRLIFVVFTIVIFSSGVFAQSPAPLRNPWKGFGIGSSVQLRTTIDNVGEKGEDNVESRKIQKIDVNGFPEVRMSRVIKGQSQLIGGLPNEQGADPEQVGLKLESKNDTSLEINGKEFEVTVSKWVHIQNNELLANLSTARSNLESRGPLGVLNVTVQLTLYETKAPGVNVPYHEIPTYGTNIALGPRVVKAEFRYVELNEAGKPIHEVRHVEAVKKFNAEYEIKGKKIPCVVVEEGGSLWDIGFNRPMKRKGECWYSNDVPGREVKHEFSREDPGVEIKTKSIVEDFDVQPDLSKAALSDAFANPQRRQILDPRWKKMRLGAWRIFLRQTSHLDEKETPSREIFLHQVIDIRENGDDVTISKVLKSGKWEVESYEIVDPQPPFDKNAKPAEREEIKVMGETVACKKYTNDESDDFSTTKTIQWYPIEKKWIEALSGVDRKYIKEVFVNEMKPQTDVIKDSGEVPTFKYEDILVSLKVTSIIGGKAVTGAKFTTVAWANGKQQFTEHTFLEKSVPGESFASIKTEAANVSFFHVLDFGEGDQPLPTNDQLRASYKQALQFLKAVEPTK